MNQKMILLVEDNADDEALTLRALNKSKVANKIVVVRDGAEALRLSFLHGCLRRTRSIDLPQVILLDLKLPKVDGLEVLRRIRSEPTTRMLPVVILTSSKEEQDMVNAYTSGANSYVRKPVDFNQFVDAIGQLGPYIGWY